MPDQDHFVLWTPNLILRNFLPSDLSDYLAMNRDAKYQRFYSEEDCSDEKAASLVDLFIQQAQQNPRTAYQLAITEKTSHRFVGTCGIRREGNNASMGCGLVRGFHGTGYAKEASHALMAFGFETLGVSRVYAETIGENRSAIALCRQLGLVEEARIKDARYFKHQWWDSVRLSIDAQTWRKNVAIRERANMPNQP
ncbi:GNAT family N-acetyltransferase [Parasalinivibrio latis]|uniref:GNAT family N-acetyltransferase n=1 Tax=Parasalinivibrio latis TaxID=2952610 RepID=UPI0030E321BA